MVAAILLASLAVGGRLWLDSPGGRARLEAMARRLTVGSGVAQLSVSGLGPGLPWTLEADELALADAQGVWLSAHKLRLRLDASALWSRTLRVSELAAERLTVLRRPAKPGGAASQDTPPIAPDAAPETDGPNQPLRLLPQLPAGLRLGIERISIARLELGDAADAHGGLLGRNRTAALEVRGGMGVQRNRSDIELEATALEGPPDRLRLSAGLESGSGALNLTLLADGPPGGLLAALAGLPDGSGLAAHAEGSGSLQDWRGTFSAGAGGLGGAQGEVRLAGWPRWREAAVRGQVSPEAGALSPAALALLGSRVDFGLAVQREAGERLRLDGSELTGARLRLRLGGIVDTTAQTLDTVLEAEVPTLPPDVRSVGLEVEADKPLTLRVSGPWSGPRAELDAEVRRLAMREWAAAGLTLRLMLAQGGRGRGGLEVEASLGLGGLERNGAVAFGPATARLEARTPDYRRFAVQAFRLEGQELTAEASGQGDAKDLSASGSLRVEAPDLRRLEPLSGLRAGGAMRLSADLAAPAGGGFDGRLQGALTNLSGLPPALAALAGDAVGFSAEARMDRRAVRLSAARLSGRNLDLTGQGQADLPARTFSAGLAGAIPQSGTVLAAAGLDGAGRVNVFASAQGRFDQFRADAQLTAPELRLGGEDLRDARISLAADGLPARPAGELRAGMLLSGGPLDALLPFALDRGRNRLNLTNARIEAPGAAFSASVEADIRSGLSSGVLRGDIPSVASLAAMAGLEAEGSAALSANLRPEAGRQSADIRLTGNGLSLPDMRIGGLDLRATARDLLGKPSGQADAVLRDLERGALRLEQARARAASEGPGYSAALSLRGSHGEPLTLEAAGSLTPARAGWTTRLTSLQGRLGKTPLALDSPAVLDKDGQAYRLSGLSLRFGEARLTAQGTVSPRDVQGKAELTALPIARILPDDVAARSGLLDASLDLSGSGEAPQGRLSFSARELRFATPKGESAPLAVRGQAGYSPGRPGRLSLNADLLGVDNGPGRLELAVPANLRLAPAAFSLPGDGRLVGLVRSGLDLAVLEPFLDLDETQYISGRAGLDLQLAGTVEDPAISGPVVIENGRFEDVESGTVIAGTEATLRAEGRKVTLERLTATDGAAGRLSATGQMTFTLQGQVDYALDIDATQAVLVRRKKFTGSCDGKAAFAGNARGARVTGRLTILRAELNIPDRLPPALTEMRVTWVNVPTEYKARQRLSAVKRRWLVGLGLELEIPGRFMVRARGLEAEYQGRLAVSGDHRDTIIRGRLELVRGRLTFLDIPFALRESDLDFDGSPNPRVNLLAEARKNDITAQVRLRGPLDAPKIELTADPPLPQDEVLSRLLFGRSVGSLSPVQAVMLASAVQGLAGGSTGPDITGTVRGMFGLDDLSLSTEASGGYTLEAGKYITDKVFLRIEKGITSEDDLAKLEIELTPTISLESQVGRQQGTGLGLYYKKDY